jgi:hypothetical protein
MCALMPRTSDLPGVEDTGVDAWMRTFRRESSLAIWAGVLVGSLVFMLLPIATLGVPLPACFLGKRMLDTHARKISTLPVYLLRQPIFLVKMMAGLCWGAHADVRKYLHLAPYPSDPGTWRST